MLWKPLVYMQLHFRSVCGTSNSIYPTRNETHTAGFSIFHQNLQLFYLYSSVAQLSTSPKIHFDLVQIGVSYQS